MQYGLLKDKKYVVYLKKFLSFSSKRNQYKILFRAIIYYGKWILKMRSKNRDRIEVLHIAVVALRKHTQTWYFIHIMKNGYNVKLIRIGRDLYSFCGCWPFIL